jgi:hypothetical protein
MRGHFKNRTGYDRWADIEEVTMLVQLDGTVVTSLPDTYCSERLVLPEETVRWSPWYAGQSVSEGCTY